MSTKLISTLRFIILGWMMYSLSYAEEAQVRSKTAKLTDMAALSVQDRSINKLKSLLSQYRGTPREPEFLVRLADLYMERSGISFRISEGAATKKTHLYKESLKESVKIFSEIIAKYPYYVGTPMAHFKRGKAYKELAQIKNAKTDYLWLDSHAQDFEYLDSVLIDLADFAQDAAQHQEALGYLGKVEKMIGSDYYPLALHRSAWSHFNLANFQQAHDYLKREIGYYFESTKDQKEAGSGAEVAFLEAAFNDLALFYFESINKKSSFATPDKAIALFDKLDESKDRKYFGPTAARFARLLKAYTLVPEMNQVNKIMISDYVKTPETADIAMLVFQFHAERREYNLLPAALADLNKVRAGVKSKDLDSKVESAVSGALTNLHKLVIKNKLATERNTLFRPLIALTESVSELLGNENSTALMANYSLAETSFELGEYERATQKYVDLLDPKYAKTLEAKKITRPNLALRLLSSRYRELKKDKLVPEKLTIRALNTKVSPAPKDQIKKMNDWIAWVDQFTQEISKSTPVEDKLSYWAFNLEANKLTYEYIDQQRALTRLEEFSYKHADTDEGNVSITIVLDTLAKSEDSIRLYDVTQKVLAVKNWKSKGFLEKVAEQSADSHLKITLKVEKPEEILARTKECQSKFKNSKVSQECLIIEAKTELKLQQYEKADKEFTTLMSQVKDANKVQPILLMRSDARNKLGRLDDSVHDLFQYQTMTEFKDADITQTILQHYWFKRDTQHLDALLKNPKVCAGKNAEACEQYQVVRVLEEGDSKMNYQKIFKNTTHGDKGLVTVWALTALQTPKKLPFQDRLVLLNRLATSWEHLNPLLQVHLLPTLQTRVKDTLESIQVSAPGIAPLTEDTATIERRMKLMQEIDATFAKVMKLPWLEIKIKGANELGIIYERLVRDLRGINTPEDLLKPFVNKSKEINNAIQQLQAMAINYTGVSVQQVAVAPGKSGKAVPSRAPASATKAQNQEVAVKNQLLSKEVENTIPANLWGEWKNGVEHKRRDYLFYLVSVTETANPEFKNISPVVKGMVLLFADAPAEAYELVKNAPETPFKATVLTQFQGVKP